MLIAKHAINWDRWTIPTMLEKDHPITTTTLTPAWRQRARRVYRATGLLPNYYLTLPGVWMMMLANSCMIGSSNWSKI